MNKGTSWLGAVQHPFELVAVPCCIDSSTWLYVSAVNRIVLCPKRSDKKIANIQSDIISHASAFPSQS